MDARRIALAAASVAALAVLAPQHGAAAAARVEPALFAAMHWRMIGPFRGGREVAVGGVAGDARIAYFGAVGGGVWKTENAGRTWTPLMDQEPVAG